ncbi:MAG: P1 family peptidase [Actinobacteria bacterium]|nr:P1 family peptidase [Actinomycetota bacterium]
MEFFSIADIEDIEIGHAQDSEAGTGCTVILCKNGATAGVDVRGGGPATRETDLLRSENMIEKIHAVLLSGGSAFGLDAAAGVMCYLEEAGVGFDVGVGKVPIVCAASLFDLLVGDSSIRPDKSMGHEACMAATSDGSIGTGNVGAGTGASVGKLAGPGRSMKSGIGTYGFESGGLQVAAIVAVNSVGTVIDSLGNPLAGTLSKEKERVLKPSEAILELVQDGFTPFSSNTTIACVVTNARLTKAQANKVSSMAHDGFARAIRPVHTSNDGDTVFVVATGKVDAPLDIVGIMAADACEEAIRDAVNCAHSAYGLKAAVEIA